ncbi:hypothetical protein [Pseudoruegeria sp. HB172150]|uniref:hypothetical protein n=1 Tax=Pseudoruegeria sp. HB172150 TaxID=2721164 RepID=UPI0015563263|nr:hypothetical protein [Pseudoruegeria sp. HB172150]
MSSQTDLSNRMQKAIDWAIFGFGALALCTAIAATTLARTAHALSTAPVAETIAQQ